MWLGENCVMASIIYNWSEQNKEGGMGRTYSTHGEPNAYRVLVVKPEGKRPIRGARRKYKDNIKLDFRDQWK
jgi:hypothetical protein